MNKVVDPTMATRTREALDGGILTKLGSTAKFGKTDRKPQLARTSTGEFVRVSDMRDQLAVKLKLFQEAVGNADKNISAAMSASERIAFLGSHRPFVDHENMGDLDTIMLTTSFSTSTMER